MLFRDYVELLYKAYLEDRKIIQTLRDKFKDGSYLQDLEDDPGLDDWERINPRAIDPKQYSRSRYYPSLHNPQEGIRVYENKNHKALNKLREVVQRRNYRHDQDR